MVREDKKIVQGRSMKSLQETYAPSSTCFGCGPSNEKGLKIRSFVEGEKVIAIWTPEAHHEAFPGVLNGGIIGSLLDCHCNWTAAWHIMSSLSLDKPLCTVTAHYSINLFRPTPSKSDVRLEAHIVDYDGKHKVDVKGTLFVDGKACASCSGLFVAVKEGHPAYHRWG